MEFSFQTQIVQLDYINYVVLRIPAEIVAKVGGVSNQRFMCTVNGAKPFHGGFQGMGDGEACIIINSARLKAAKAAIGDVVDLHLVKDESKYGMEVPEELQEVLLQIPHAEYRFENLTPGRQRWIIHYVSGVKSPQKRVERALLLIGNLVKLPEGKEQYRDLLGIL